MISDNYAAYSDLTVLKDKTIGVLWERGVEVGYKFITFTRLNREWLEQGTHHLVISRGEAGGHLPGVYRHLPAHEWRPLLRLLCGLRPCLAATQ